MAIPTIVYQGFLSSYPSNLSSFSLASNGSQVGDLAVLHVADGNFPNGNSHSLNAPSSGGTWTKHPTTVNGRSLFYRTLIASDLTGSHSLVNTSSSLELQLMVFRNAIMGTIGHYSVPSGTGPAGTATKDSYGVKITYYGQGGDFTRVNNSDVNYSYYYKSFTTGQIYQTWPTASAGWHNNDGYIAYTVLEANALPTAPTGVSVSGAVAPNGNPIVSWSHSDPDGNPQSKYQIRWRKA